MKDALNECITALEPMVKIAQAHQNYWGDPKILLLGSFEGIPLTLYDCRLAKEVTIKLKKELENL